MRKATILLLTVFTAVMCSGCGKSTDKTEISSSGGQEVTETGTVAETTGADGETDESGEDSPRIYEHFSGGTLYEEGAYLFRIDSMGMTEEGYEIQYSTATDSSGYSPYFEMNVVVNGIRTSFEGIQFYNDTEDGQLGSSDMLGSTETPARLVISKEYLAALGASEVHSLQLSVTLGRREGNTINPGAELEYTLYPGDAVQTSDLFPEPERESWLLMDNEYGKVQILRAAYPSDDDGRARVHAYILVQGAGGEDFPKYGYDVSIRRMADDGRTFQFADGMNQSYRLMPEAALYEVRLCDYEIPYAGCEDNFLSDVSVCILSSGSSIYSEDKVIDFTHLEYEEE